MTALTATTEGQLKALAMYVSAVRDSWDRPGILAALHACTKPGRTLEQLEHVALAVARDLTARTPAVIAQAARWDLTEPTTKAGFTPVATFCDRCRAVTIPDEPHDCRAKTAPSPTYLDAKAAAKFAGPERIDAQKEATQ